MVYTVIGSFSFVFLFIFDRNKLLYKLKYNFIFNYTGMILLFLSTIGIIFSDRTVYKMYPVSYIFLATAIIFFTLLIYSLFIELPLKDTYIKADCGRNVVDTGTYALCRHPGVIWFTLAYFSLALSLGTLNMYTAAAVWSVLNIIYIILQEKLFFKKMFAGYTEYINSTPMLIPNWKSIRKCVKTLVNK